MVGVVNIRESIDGRELVCPHCQDTRLPADKRFHVDLEGAIVNGWCRETDSWETWGAYLDGGSLYVFCGNCQKSFMVNWTGRD